jgi:hypothetical protein
MKTYTITLPKKEDTAKIYKDNLLKRVITAYPWLTVDSKFDYPYSNNGVEYASAGDVITLGLSNTHKVSWLPKECANCPFKCWNEDTINFDLEKEFFKAINALDIFAKENYPFEKDYDFEDEFGTPIKIFDNFVQIGYDIIPIMPGSLNHLKPKTKKTIINITIKIKNRGLF